MPRVVTAFGTRPEAIKMAPVVYALRRIPGLDVRILLTGQHREQLDSALATFDLRGDVDLSVMLASQPLPELAARLIPAAAAAISELGPAYLLVHGDTMSAFCVALAGFLARVPVGHVEAGLRSGVLDDPWPEEASRRLTDVLTDLDLAPTPLAAQNLLRENKDPATVIVTGNTVVDAVNIAADLRRDEWDEPGLIAVTLHRRESWPILSIMAASLARVASAHPDRHFVYPVHMNPIVRAAVTPALSGLSNVELMEPLEYASMAALLRRADLVVTDSGGIVEEAVSLGTYVAILRNVTERPEGIDAGLAELVGTDETSIETRLNDLLDAPPRRSDPGMLNPYGDGQAAERVASAVSWRLGGGPRPIDWRSAGNPR